MAEQIYLELLAPLRYRQGFDGRVDGDAGFVDQCAQWVVRDAVGDAATSDSTVMSRMTGSSPSGLPVTKVSASRRTPARSDRAAKLIYGRRGRGSAGVIWWT
ncbi:hypothetical protein [Mycobacterium tilburgii]|uniref:hypothetical protein n=1 Tax=Mycobacterium tilburgii TaxID=44467 RepID=UPI0021B4A318|nr:hypothetical protein [Mycobacterium tilburgii]